jgi:hypothetical protein
MFLYDEPPAECFHCEAKDETLKELRYWFRSVCELIYGIEEFNAENLDYYLNEIALHLGVKFPDGPPVVEAKPKQNDISMLLDAWKNANVEYLKSLSPTGS